jgi:hypothetical protein
MDEVGRYVEQHCYLCERTISATDTLVVNGGVQVIPRYRLRAHRRCWLERYGGPKEEQASMRLEGEA